jgi:hypothetical protein
VRGVSPLAAEPFLTGPLLIDQGGAAPVMPAVITVLAQDPAPPPGKGEEFGEASPIALVVIVLLAIVTAVLIRSMTKRLKRLPPSFDPVDETADDRPGETPDGSGKKAGTERGANQAGRRPEDAGGGRA